MKLKPHLSLFFPMSFEITCTSHMDNFFDKKTNKSFRNVTQAYDLDVTLTLPIPAWHPPAWHFVPCLAGFVAWGPGSWGVRRGRGGGCGYGCGCGWKGRGVWSKVGCAVYAAWSWVG